MIKPLATPLSWKQWVCQNSENFNVWCDGGGEGQVILLYVFQDVWCVCGGWGGFYLHFVRMVVKRNLKNGRHLPDTKI